MLFWRKPRSLTHVDNDGLEKLSRMIPSSRIFRSSLFARRADTGDPVATDADSGMVLGGVRGVLGGGEEQASSVRRGFPIGLAAQSEPSSS